MLVLTKKGQAHHRGLGRRNGTIHEATVAPISQQELSIHRSAVVAANDGRGNFSLRASFIFNHALENLAASLIDRTKQGADPASWYGDGPDLAGSHREIACAH